MENNIKSETAPIPTPKELFFGSAPRKRLNQWLATGICGNDISSSCLYVSAIAAVFAGVLAPVVLLAVVFLLYLYKKVYTEVVEALPLNGGTYNCLLNSTSKFAAALAGWMTILIAITATILGMLGNVIIDYKNLLYFMQYFVPTVFLVVLMYMRIPILRTILQVLNNLMTRILLWRTTVIDRITAITNQRVVIFARGGNLSRLNTAFSYIMHNESSRAVVVLHLYDNPNRNEEVQIKKSLETLKEIYPTLKSELVVRQDKFGSEIIQAVSKEFKVPVNNIFIGAPEEKHTFSIQDLGGVRVIFQTERHRSININSRKRMDLNRWIFRAADGHPHRNMRHIRFSVNQDITDNTC